MPVQTTPNLPQPRTSRTFFCRTASSSSLAKAKRSPELLFALRCCRKSSRKVGRCRNAWSFIKQVVSTLYRRCSPSRPTPTGPCSTPLSRQPQWLVSHALLVAVQSRRTRMMKKLMLDTDRLQNSPVVHVFYITHDDGHLLQKSRVFCCLPFQDQSDTNTP